jgi:ABC-type Zn2+ transport system substrate-binding protein/surface adhesin
MIATSSAPFTTQDAHAVPDHGHDHGHGPSHAGHDHGHAHAHDHGAAHGASHRVAQAVPGIVLSPSFLRASLGARLTLAGGLAVLVWLLVFWARMPISGGAS